MADAASTMSKCQSRPCLVGLRRPLWIGLAIGVLSLPAVVVGYPPDEVESEDGAQPEQPFEIGNERGRARVFGAPSNADEARTAIDTFLGQELAIIDRVCALNDAQRQKLRLAPRGDSKRLVDRAAIATGFRRVKNGRGGAEELFSESQWLQHGLGSGPSTAPFETLLMFKVLNSTLTAEQFDKYRSFGAVLRAGGRLRNRQRVSEEGLAIDLTRAAFADDDFAHLGKLSGVNSL